MTRAGHFELGDWLVVTTCGLLTAMMCEHNNTRRDDFLTLALRSASCAFFSLL